ncbi:B12-binding domain-containing radical SAM protein [Bacillus cereus]|uniref:B12-binding domain-containing radical SAM protein n=1 Tax=Bacillus cereus TaxID=1396 RepID=UPI00065C0C6D|nr:radical SAM protein [Bacillus cereus]KMQ32172.1 hypothetical protein TU58_01410 [Bacillus cereus]
MNDNRPKFLFIVLLDGDLVMSPEHVGVGYLLSVLRQNNIECKVIELSRDNHEKCLQDIGEFNPAIIGFSLMSINLHHASEFGHKIRKHYPHIHITCGGPCATYGVDALLESDTGQFLDSAVTGEGEEAIIELYEHLEQGLELEGVMNVAYRKDGQVVVNKIRKPIHNLDSLPMPARDQFEAAGSNLEYLRISTSRGCTSHCTFCSAPHVGNMLVPSKVWRGRSAVSMADEITELVNKYNFRTFDFVDSTFEDPGVIGKRRLKEFAEILIERNLEIYYNCCFQALNWSDNDSELLSLLFQSGLEKVLVGIESGTEEGLKRWQKRSTIEDNKRVIRLLRENDIYLAFGFIMFHPHSSLEEVRENTKFLREHVGENLRRFGTRLEVYPGTAIERELSAEGLLGENYQRTLDCMDYKYIDEEIGMFANSFAGLFGEQYMKTAVIDKEPAVFEFESYLIIVHTFISRLKRKFGHNPEVAVEIELFKEKIHGIYREMGEYNFHLIDRGLDLLERGGFTPDYFLKQADPVEKYFYEKMQLIRKLQLKFSRNIMKMGCNLREIDSKLLTRVN